MQAGSRPGANADDSVIDIGGGTGRAEQHGKYERVAGARFFAARVDGQLAGSCELHQEGEDAQVEHVGTLKQFRGRGVARSVILRAVQAARETGERYAFIVTDEEDWPRHLYARLGFDQIGRAWEFLRSPDSGGGVVRTL